MTSADSWPIAMYVGFGLAAVIAAVGIFIACWRLGGLLLRLHKTLDEVDRQIENLGNPVATTLTHVGGIADTADSTIARLGVAVGQLESVATVATKAASSLLGSTFGGVAGSMRKTPRQPREAEDV